MEDVQPRCLSELTRTNVLHSTTTRLGFSKTESNIVQSKWLHQFLSFDFDIGQLILILVTIMVVDIIMDECLYNKSKRAAIKTQANGPVVPIAHLKMTPSSTDK